MQYALDKRIDSRDEACVSVAMAGRSFINVGWKQECFRIVEKDDERIILSLDRRSCESQRTNSRWERNSSRYGNHCDNHRSECIQSRSTENPIDKIVKRGKTDAEGNPHSFLCLTKHFRIIEVVVENLWCTENYLLSTWRYNDWPITAYRVLP